MNFFESLSSLFGATPKPALVEASGATIDPDDDLYRPITGSRRDLTTIEADKARRISLYLWRRNGMGHRLIEMLTDFLVGDGLTFVCPDRRAQEIVDEWWGNPGMRLHERHRDLVRDLHLYGELAMTVAVNPESGRMRLGLIDVDRIVDVLPDPEDALTDLTLMVRRGGSGETSPIDLIRYDELTDPVHPGWVGDAFYFGLNRVVGQHRGTPTLLALADYIDGWDQLVFDAHERASLLNAFVFDVTLKGFNDAQVADWVHRNGAAPRPGSVRAHNETEMWEVKSPDLAAADTTQLARMVKNAALGSFGAPEAWFADGDSANRATLVAQGDPTYQMLRRQQQDTKAMFGLLAQYVLYRASMAGRLPASADLTVEVHAPELSTKDTGQLSTALTQATNALVAAQVQGYIDERSARRVFLMMVGQLGLRLDEGEVQRTVEQARADTEPTEGIEQAVLRAAGLPVRSAPARGRGVEIIG